MDADQSTGRIIHLPNGWIFKQAVANYTAGFKFIWDEISVMVTFESDWGREVRCRVNHHSGNRVLGCVVFFWKRFQPV